VRAVEIARDRPVRDVRLTVEAAFDQTRGIGPLDHGSAVVIEQSACGVLSVQIRSNVLII
jgi:hypothetical protein